ncbi:MAG: phage holin family protein [Nocardioidaceae bacterium]
MAEHAVEPTAGQTPSNSRAAEPTVAELVSQLSEQSSKLLRSELELAKAEMQEKAKRAGAGAGLFGAAGITALFGVGTLITTVILALALVLPAWLAALIVTVVLFVVAGVVGLVGRKQVSQATPAAPQQTIDSVKRDIETVKESRHHDDTA